MWAPALSLTYKPHQSVNQAALLRAALGSLVCEEELIWALRLIAILMQEKLHTCPVVQEIRLSLEEAVDLPTGIKVRPDETLIRK